MDAEQAVAGADKALEARLLRRIEDVAGSVEEHHGVELPQLLVVEPRRVLGEGHGEALLPRDVEQRILAGGKSRRGDNRRSSTSPGIRAPCSSSACAG